jgi:integrase
MALVLRPEARHWVAAIKVNGKLCRFPLTCLQDGLEAPIPIEGRRPSSLKRLEEGDRIFMNSYHTALAAHDRLAQDLKSKKTEVELAEKVLKARTGKNTKVVKIADIPGLWRKLPRKRKPGEKYLNHGGAVLARFVEFMGEVDSELVDVYDITERHLRNFLGMEDERGLSGRTWNVTLTHLRTVFSRVAPTSPAYLDYLRNVPLRDENTVHRKPFSDEELEAILKTVRKDDVIRGPVITAICSGMRKGDCCTLQWKSVDLKGGFITVQTSKTRETCQIPILPLLREELEAVAPAGEDVFPEAAAFYRDPKQRHLLDTRFARMMREAGFDTGSNEEKKKQIKSRPGLKQVDPETLIEFATDAVEHAGYQLRKKKVMLDVLRSYASGKSLPEVSKELGVAKGTVSLHLNTLEEITGCEVLRRPKRPEQTLGHVVEDNGDQRLKRGSVRGWHSFRTTFVTRALSAGMPEELVRRVTGHTTVDVVRTHYLQPDREDFRREFERVAPKMTLGRVADEKTKTDGQSILKALEAMTAKTWKQERDRLVKSLKEGSI